MSTVSSYTLVLLFYKIDFYQFFNIYKLIEQFNMMTGLFVYFNRKFTLWPSHDFPLNLNKSVEIPCLTCPKIMGTIYLFSSQFCYSAEELDLQYLILVKANFWHVISTNLFVQDHQVLVSDVLEYQPAVDCFAVS